MRAWEHKLQVWNMNQIWCAVRNEAWQVFRMSLKGISTDEKLDRLDNYLRAACIRNVCTVDELQTREWVEKCRVDNYINALLRGGQLKYNECGERVVQR